MTDGQRKKRASEYFRKGLDAIVNPNLGYAILMFQSALRLDPENAILKDVLDATERRRKDTENGGGTPIPRPDR